MPVELRDLEVDISDLCRAVKVISSVIADQLQHSKSGPPRLSEYGLEVQTFEVDASMVRYAVDHAAVLALALKDRIEKG